MQYKVKRMAVVSSYYYETLIIEAESEGQARKMAETALITQWFDDDVLIDSWTESSEIKEYLPEHDVEIIDSEPYKE